MEESAHILNILRKVKKSLQERDYIRLKILSDKVIEHVSVHQDSDLLSVTVIIYALSKLIERESYKKEKNWDRFYKGFLMNINEMIKALEREDMGGFRDEIKQNSKLLQGLTGRLKLYLSDVFRKARINKASKVYDQGISMERTARLLGVSIWEVSEYAGHKPDVNLAVTMPIRERVKLAEEIFE
ncbi:hypothetical protein CMI42_03995 [Candidatus Pacearchaeota archaeon]|nr:hypothetical protein [Candidatus Pacearchaeota archaeon]|tara:strand:+ start:2130 stop:2684 length:555 start_codon:yes stop_codon:yes gene_type:complete